MKKEFFLTIYLQPGSKKSEICGMHDGHIKIKLNAPPVDGKANAALILFLSNLIGIPKSSIELISGQKSRIKRIKITGISQEMIDKKIKKSEQ
ncbi:MAG: hypothetical protein ACD_46C00713G0005 [uncultured bacterium]|nr:MAG: hypothetical protein ACD_46C00713G0005 [uncultured bacterium]